MPWIHVHVKRSLLAKREAAALLGLLDDAYKLVCAARFLTSVDVAMASVP